MLPLGLKKLDWQLDKTIKMRNYAQVLNCTLTAMAIGVSNK